MVLPTTEENMRISIITPSYNQGRFIRQTIDSVLSQNYPDLEYIVCDGGSHDETVSILKSYGTRIKWVSEKDRGQTDAINKGLRMTTGDIIAYINSDDYYLPETLKKIAEFFKKNPKAQWVTGDYQIVNEKGKPIQQFIVWYKRFLRLFPTKNMLYFTNFIAQPSTFWRRSHLKTIGLFNESLRYVMDYEYWLRSIEQFPLSVIYSPLSVFRIHSLSKGGSQYPKQFSEELKVLELHTGKIFVYYLHVFSNRFIVWIYTLIK